MRELYEWYHTGVGTLSDRAKRVILLDPQIYGWSDIGETWDNGYHIPITDNGNIEDIIDRIGDMIRF